MPRIADALERESQTVDLEHGDFERLLSRRERKQRNRRIRAGVVGIVIALAAAAFLGRSMIVSEPVPANPPPPVDLPADPGAWQRVVLPGGPPGCTDNGCLVRDIAAGDAGLVAMGSHFMCCGEAFAGWSSPDGVSWNQIESDGASEAKGLAAAGPGFVAARSEKVSSSTDGVSWELTQPSSDPEDQYLSVTGGGPGVVAVGSPGKAWFSADGLTWQAAEVPPTQASTSMTEVAAGANRIVATGWTGHGNRTKLVLWVSSDGTSWRDVPIRADVFSLSCRIVDVAGGSAGFVATGWCGQLGHEGDYLVWRSVDGVNWSRVGDALQGQTPYFAVSGGPAGFIGTNGQRVWTSVDGASWTQVPTGPVFKGATAVEVIAWRSRFVAVGNTHDDQNVVWISGPQR